MLKTLKSLVVTKIICTFVGRNNSNMYILHPIIVFVCFVIVEAVIFAIIFKSTEFLVEKFVDIVIGRWLFCLIHSEHMIRIHEAGHLVAYLKTISNFKRSRYLKYSKRIRNMVQGAYGGAIYINTNAWNNRRKLLIAGGLAATLKYNHKSLTRMRYTYEYYLGGCGSDLYKLRHYYKMSKTTVIWFVNSMICSFTDDDMKFIIHVADKLGEKKLLKQNTKICKTREFDDVDLFEIADEYRMTVVPGIDRGKEIEEKKQETRRYLKRMRSKTIIINSSNKENKLKKRLKRKKLHVLLK